MLIGITPRGGENIAVSAGELLADPDVEVPRRCCCSARRDAEFGRDRAPDKGHSATPIAHCRGSRQPRLAKPAKRQRFRLLRDAYLSDTGNLVLTEAVDAIARIGGAAAVSCLTNILIDTALFRNLRWPAARALGVIGDARALRQLIAALSDESELVRENAARALGEIRAREASSPLMESLHDSDAGVRSAAAGALGKMTATDAVGALCRTMGEDRHAYVRESAARALMQLDRERLPH